MTLSSISGTIGKLIRAAKGDPTAMAQLADAASGRHMERFFKTQDEVLKGEIDAMTRDGFLEIAKQVDFLSTSFIVVLEILDRLVADKERAVALEKAWDQHGGEPPPLRDLISGATRIEDAYSRSTAPIQRLYVDALRGSFAPAIYGFGRGPELMDALIRSGVGPVEIEHLEDLRAKGDRQIQLTAVDEKLESYEHLAGGDFVEMLQSGSPGHPLFIRHRTEAVHPAVKIRITPRGRRLLDMIAAGRGRVAAR